MGLKVYARLDDNAYPKGIKITDRQLATVNLTGVRVQSSGGLGR